MALTLVIFHFATPFVLLLMRAVKRHADRLLKVCLMMLVIRVVDVYWIVEPAFYDSRLRIHWMDFVTPVRGRRPVAGGVLLAIEIEAAGSAERSATGRRAAGDGGVLDIDMEAHPRLIPGTAMKRRGRRERRPDRADRRGLWRLYWRSCALLVYGIFRYLAEHPLTRAAAESDGGRRSPQVPPAPRLEEHPAIEIAGVAVAGRPDSLDLWVDRQERRRRADSDRSRDGACNCSADFRRKSGGKK